MSLTVAQYWEDHKLSSLASLPITPTHGDAEVIHDPGGLNGTVDATAHFPMGSLLEVWEDVEIRGGTPHRRKYSYHFQPSNEREWVRFDYDPVIGDDMQHHVNRPSDVHEPDTWRSLKDVVGMCWVVDADASLSGVDLP